LGRHDRRESNGGIIGFEWRVFRVAAEQLRVWGFHLEQRYHFYSVVAVALYR
jgi:hypothetical protein